MQFGQQNGTPNSPRQTPGTPNGYQNRQTEPRKTAQTAKSRYGDHFEFDASPALIFGAVVVLQGRFVERGHNFWEVFSITPLVHRYQHFV